MLFVRVLIVCLLFLLPAVFTACDTAEEAADSTEQAGEGAVDLAEKMSEGTLGDALDEEEDL